MTIPSIEIATYDGKLLDLSTMIYEDVDLRTCVRVLASKPRWGGHTNEDISVLSHSLEVERIVGDLLLRDDANAYNDETERQVRLQALLHDFPETYIGDFMAPIKRHLPLIQELEDHIWKCVALKFDVPIDFFPEVKQADLIAQAMERRDQIHPEVPWQLMIDGQRVETMKRQIQVLNPHAATKQFMRRFHDLTVAQAPL